MPIDRSVSAIGRLFAAARRAVQKELTTVDISGYKELGAMRASRRISAILAGLRKAARREALKAMRETYEEKQREFRVSASVLGLRRRKVGAGGMDGHLRESAMSIIKALDVAIDSVKRSTDLIVYAKRMAALGLGRLQAFDEFDLADIGGIISGIIDDAISAGWSRIRVSKLLELKIGAIVGEARLVNVRGRNYELEYYTEMVARTELRRGQSEATKALCSDYECDLVEFSAHAKPCDECAGLEGQVFSISGKHPTYPPLTADATPPIHPNCEHSIAPTTELGIEFREQYA